MYLEKKCMFWIKRDANYYNILKWLQYWYHFYAMSMTKWYPLIYFYNLRSWKMISDLKMGYNIYFRLRFNLANAINAQVKNSCVYVENF